MSVEWDEQTVNSEVCRVIMASQDGRSEEEEEGKVEAGTDGMKPGQMDSIATMLASMRQEMAVDHEAQARRAREQAHRADVQAHHFVEALQSSLTSLKVEMEQ